MLLFRRLILSFILLAALAAIIYFAAFHRTVHRFEHWSGPAATSVLPQLPDARPDAFGKGADSRLALLVTDRQSAWLSLAHGLRSIGVPFEVTFDPIDAVRHRVVLAYPTISGKLMTADGLRALAGLPRSGGTLIGFEILGGGLEEVFGISGMAPVESRRRVVLSVDAARPAGLDDLEALLPVSGSAERFRSYAIAVAQAETLARYDDGSAVITRRRVGQGAAMAIGVDLGALLSRAYGGRQQLDQPFINAYTPATDTWLRLLKSWYRAAEPLAFTLSPAPAGHALSVVITHDIDYAKSLHNALRYAEAERAAGISATYFVQTKYVQDWNDKIFFDDEGVTAIRKLASLGMEIGSHSVSHSKVFSSFPMGEGDERYPRYQPFVRSGTQASGGSILGELRVSRFLLEQAVPEQPVLSFRPGHLQYPFRLPEALQATRYRFSSSASSGMASSYLPFRLNEARENRAETEVYEFPITIEDERDRPMTSRLQLALSILRQLKRYGGMCVVLIHPNVFDDKLEFLQAFQPAAREAGAWIGSLKQMGEWWAARDSVTIDAEPAGPGVTLTLRGREGVHRLAVELPDANWRLEPGSFDTELVKQAGARINIDTSRQVIQLKLSRRR